MQRPRILYFAWADSAHTHRWATAMQKEGFDLEVLSVGGVPVEGVPTTIYPYRGSTVYLKTYFRAMDNVRKYNPDMIHIHSISGFSLWAQGLRDRKRIISVWGSDITETAQSGLGNMLIGRALRKAERVTATSQSLASETRRLFPFTSSKLSVIPFGVDLPVGIPEMPPLPPDGPLRVCLLKCDRTLYGGHLAIEAVARLRDSQILVKLTLLAPDQNRIALADLIERFQLHDQVELRGQIPHAQIGDFLAEYHLLLRPSLADAFGVAVLEAASYGRATIASRVGGLPEVVRDSETGFLIQPGSVDELTAGILKFVQDPSLCVSMGNSARAFVSSEYLWPRSVKKMNELYSSVLEAGVRP